MKTRREEFSDVSEIFETFRIGTSKCHAFQAFLSGRP
jgi:hypothetical protein